MQRHDRCVTRTLQPAGELPAKLGLDWRIVRLRQAETPEILWTHRSLNAVRNGCQAPAVLVFRDRFSGYSEGSCAYGIGGNTEPEGQLKISGERTQADRFSRSWCPQASMLAHMHAKGEEFFYVLDGEVDRFAFEPVTRTAGGWQA